VINIMARIPATPPVEKFVSEGGLRVYRMRLEVFPGFYAHAHLVLGLDVPILIDTGSGLDNSNAELVERFGAVQSEFGETVGLKDVGRILVTHGHMDHFGGVQFVVEASGAKVGIHVLDKRVLTNYEERVLIASKSLREFLGRAGVEGGSASEMMDLYMIGKGFYRSVPVEFLLDESVELFGCLQFLHVPGHCGGQVCIRMGDILFTADHVLARITPHQSPESITRNVGVGHYLESLLKVRDLPNVRVGLGGHEVAVTNLARRVDEIWQAHQDRLERVLSVCAEPRTINAVAFALFGPLQGYNALLGLEEAGAHVEYLYQRAELGVANLDRVHRDEEPAIQYVRL